MLDIVDFTPQLLVAIVGTILSVIFAKFPIVNTWFAGLASEFKSLIMIGLLLIVSVVVYLLAINGIIETTQPLTVWLLIKIFISALIANQATYTITPESAVVKEIKRSRI